MQMPNLYYSNKITWTTLPNWCQFYINIGLIIGSWQKNSTRLIMGIAVPSRSFAASFVATGIVMARSLIPHDINKEEYFKYLCSLSIGTPLVFRDGTKKKIGFYDGTEMIQGESRIRIQLADKHKTTNLIGKERVLEVSLGSDPNTKISERQKGKNIIFRRDFINALLPQVDTYDFALNSRLECAILGKVNWLSQEIKTKFAVDIDDQEYLEGNLQDVLRVRRFLSDGDGYRTEIFPVSTSEIPKSLNDIPEIIIFDGSLGFLKWRDDWRESNWVVILDRTEHGFSEAAETFNQDYIMNRIDSDINIKDLPPLPPGVEITFFEEVVR